jgi:hypothetical protein
VPSFFPSTPSAALPEADRVDPGGKKARSVAGELADMSAGCMCF